jgi:hypothetical protein
MILRAAVSICVIALLCISPRAIARQDETVECRSKGFDYTECAARFRRPQLVQQLSNSECVENRSWGVKTNGVIWVSAGCAAVFADGGDQYSNRDSDDNGNDNGNREDARPRDDNYPESQDRRDDRRHEQRDDRRHRERPSELVECRSHGYAFTRCDANWNSAHLIEQLSESGCVEGESWGLDDEGLWVDKGCAGRFAGE